MTILLSSKAIAALEAVLDIACNARPDPVRSSEIAARLGRPKRYLEKAMQQLAHAGILKGVRGPHGGYMLARERRRIPVGEILRIVAAAERSENDKRAANRPSRAPCSKCSLELLQTLCAEMEAEFFARLDAITIEELCARQDESAVQGEASARGAHVDFTI